MISHQPSKSNEEKNVRALAKIIGATVNVQEGEEVCVEAPEGYHWSCDDVHELVASIWDDETMRDQWVDLWMRMVHGCEKCNETCEWWGEDIS